METVSVAQIFSVAGISMLPIIELKGAIPVGLSFGMPLWFTFWLCYIFSTLPAFFVIPLLSPLMHWLKALPKIQRIFERLIARSMKKSAQIEKYGYWGIFIFVAIPLPGTGIWSGSVISSVLELQPFKAAMAVALGNLVAGLIILVFSYILI